MNIYVPIRCINYYVDSLLCGLNSSNQIMMGDNVYKERNHIDAILIDNSPLSEDLSKFLADNPTPVILINQTTSPPIVKTDYGFSPIPQEGYVYLPPFANTARYQTAIPVEQYRSDILLVVTDENEGKLANKIYTEGFSADKKVRIVGPIFTNSPGFVGLVDNQMLMAYAKSAAVVLVDNEVIRNSMLFYNMYARPFSAADEPALESKERDKYVRTNKIQLVTEKKIADIINEKLRDINS